MDQERCAASSNMGVASRVPLRVLMLLLVPALLAHGILLGAQRPVATADSPSRTAAAERILAKRVTVTLTHVSVRQAVDALAAVAGITVTYRRDVIESASGFVTLHASDMPLGEAFAHVLQGTSLQLVALPGEQFGIVASGTMVDSRSATGTIAGRVVDSAGGQGLGRATVKVQGTKLTAVTSDSGTFTLRDVPEGDQVVVVRLFGYRPVNRIVTVKAGEPIRVHIALAVAPSILSGVVTTATGQQRRMEVGNDITTLNVDSIRQVAPITSVTDLLESRVPGLTVVHSSGTPGDPSRLRLRGPGSITGSNDLIVFVDGVRVYAAQSEKRSGNLTGPFAAPSPLDQIDPNNIETIEVLKGPSASSLYGSDAANGVVVITTKKGRAGPARWTTTVDQGISYYPGDFPIQILRWGHNASDGGFSNLLASSGILTLADPLCDIISTDCNVVDSVTHFQALNLPRWSPIGHGSTTDGSVNVSGGVSMFTYAFTGSASSQLGYAHLPDALSDAFKAFHGYDAPGWAKRPNKYTTWAVATQIGAQIMPTLQLMLASNLFHGFQQRTSLEQQIPMFAGMTDTLCVFNNCYNERQLVANAYTRATDEPLRFTNAVTASWSPFTWLTLTGTAGIDVLTSHQTTLLPRDIVLTQSSDTLGHYGAAQLNSTVKTFNVTKVSNSLGLLSYALGINVASQSTSDLVVSRDTLALGANTPQTLSAPSTLNATGTTTYGWFFEPKLMLSQRFFLTPGFRLDGGNANGQNASVSGLPAHLTFAALFPKVNFSWIALDRQDGDAKPALGVFTLLRPRGSIGHAGVQPIPGDRLRLVTGHNTAASSDTLSLQKLGNTQLRPERSVDLEGGVDIEMWHNRASVQFTHDRKVQHDAIISVPVAPSVDGYARTINLNIGEVRNINTEIEATITPIRNEMVQWTMGGNYSHNDNKVMHLDPRSAALIPPISNSSGDQGRIAVGYPLFSRWAPPILGYGDENHDGIIESNEIRVGDTAVYLGRQDPAYTAAITTDLSLFHGRLGLHAQLTQQGGYSQVNNGSGSNTTFLSVANDTNATLGQQAVYVAANRPGLALTNIGLVQTVSEWRFDYLTVNYAVPTAIARRFHSAHMSVALRGSNLRLWTNYRGKDPNVNGYPTGVGNQPNGNGLADTGQLPEPRTWSLQVTLGN
jgi:TonB-dependent SusC/RagA subfamily outer membrane receptor